MKYFDTFTGYGGFTLGIQRAFNREDKNNEWPMPTSLSERHIPDSNGGVGRKQEQRSVCIGFSEVNKYAIQVYQKHFPEHFNYGDITQINPATLPDFDLLTGGFPCQAFSIAGKRQGFNDTRGTLFFDIARILKEKRPRNFILENVKGLLSHDNGRTFKTIITTLTELGYCVEWQVLNAKDFGVPQNRERVFIVGHFGGVPERKVFPIGGADAEDTKSSRRKAVSVQRCGDRDKDTYSVMDNAHTLGANPMSDYLPKVIAGAKIRRLTPKECERLMGLPDDWTEGQSDTQRYKLCGNGVVVNVVEAVVRKLYGLDLL